MENDELGTQSIGVVAEMKDDFDSTKAERMEKEIRTAEALASLSGKHMPFVRNPPTQGELGEIPPENLLLS